MAKNKVLLFLFLIIVFGAFLRLKNINTNFLFEEDQSQDVFKVLEMYTNLKSGDIKALPLIGEPGTYSVNSFTEDGYTVYSGVFFLYLLLPVAAFFAFDPAGIVLFFNISNMLGIVLMFLVGSKMFNSRVGLVAALLFAGNYYMNVYSRAIWTPSLIPIFVLLALYLFILIKKESKFNLWPLFLFVISAISQIHDSGYYYLGFFILLVLFTKPKFVSGLPKKIATIFSFFIPLLPTIIYEFKTNFLLLPSILHEFNIQLGKASSFGSIYNIFTKFWEFWISTIYPLCFEGYYKTIHGFWYFPILIIISFAFVASIFLIFSKANKDMLSRKIMGIFLITFFLIPQFAKIYYRDNFFGLFALSGTTFSTIGAMPFVFLCFAFLIDWLMNLGKLGYLASIVFLIYTSVINIRSISDAIWLNSDKKYDYGNKVEIVKSIKLDIKDRNFNFIFKDPVNYAEGIEFLYLFEKEGLQKPVTYNGLNSLSKAFYKYSFSNGESPIFYAVVGDSVWADYSDSKWLFIMELDRYRLYKMYR